MILTMTLSLGGLFLLVRWRAAAPPPAVSEVRRPPEREQELPETGVAGSDELYGAPYGGPIQAAAGAPRPPAAEGGEIPSITAPEPVAAEARPRSAPAPSAPGASGGLAASDQNALKAVLAGPRAAEGLGGKKGLLVKAESALIRHPRVLAALLNNETLINAWMNREDNQRQCNNAGALQGYLSDQSESGFGGFMRMLRESAGTPGSTEAILGSKAAKRFLDCPSVQAIADNPSSAMGVVMGNPAAIGAFSDPALSQAVQAAPAGAAVMDRFGSVLGAGQ
ncbi:MAG: hypothetical protein PHF00_06970 [Elusimicrobia bacterium]|nr:hypothetical protein [Elusimicrobiota bacterium]